jgi:hypothetical protein
MATHAAELVEQPAEERLLRAEAAQRPEHLRDERGAEGLAPGGAAELGQGTVRASDRAEGGGERHPAELLGADAADRIGQRAHARGGAVVGRVRHPQHGGGEGRRRPR